MFREGNIIPAGVDPTTVEQSEGLDVLNGLLLSKFSITVGNKLMEWQIPVQQRTGAVSREYPLLPGAEQSIVCTFPLYPPMNSRVVWDGSAQYAYLDETPNDGALLGVVMSSGAASTDPGTLTLDGNGRTIMGINTLVLASPLAPILLFYRADVADWRKVAALALTDDCLFPPDVDDLWITAGSVRLAPRYGKTIAPGTVERKAEMDSIFAALYQQTAPTSSGGEEIMPGFTSFNRFRWMW